MDADVSVISNGKEYYSSLEDVALVVLAMDDKNVGADNVSESMLLLLLLILEWNYLLLLCRLPFLESCHYGRYTILRYVFQDSA